VAATVIGLALVAAPSAAAADEPVAGTAVTGAAIEPVARPDPEVDLGPQLLLLVAGTLGFLGILSGPVLAVPDDRRATPPRRRAR
jgi:hypothetical protein